MIVLVTTLLVVEANEDLLLVLAELDLQRLTGRQALRQVRRFCLDEQCKGVRRLRREREAGLVARREPGGTVDVLSRLLAVATVDAAAGPDPHDVALAYAAL